jgi:tRNA A-37 threonylcarbamoyl transferase component Bud32
MGAVLRVGLPAHDTTSGRRETAGCYLKVYRNERGRETFELLRSWGEGARPGRRPYGLVRPIAYLSELRTLVLEEAAGTSLRERLLEACDPVAAMRTVARAVASFHEDDLEVTRRYSLADQRDDLRQAAALVQWVCPDKRAKIGGVAAVVEHALEEVTPAPIHRDLTPEHVFLADDRVTFVDADSIALGDPLRDPALLLAHVAGRVGLEGLSEQDAHAIAVAFGEEYLRHVPAAWRKRFRLQCAGAFIETAAGIMRTQGPGWRERVSDVAAHARHALAGEFG